MSADHVERPTADPTRPGVVGLLILRVWMEDDDEASLRVRLVGRSDIERDVVETTAAATVDVATHLTRAWLERFPPLVASAVPDPARGRDGPHPGSPPSGSPSGRTA